MTNEISKLNRGDYLAIYEEYADPGTRCGYSDSELHQIRGWLADRNLGLEADDRGLRVIALPGVR
jgi:hypothetical protein